MKGEGRRRLGMWKVEGGRAFVNCGLWIVSFDWVGLELWSKLDLDLKEMGEGGRELGSWWLLIEEEEGEGVRGGWNGE